MAISAVWFLAGGTFQRAITLLLNIWLARELQKEAFGELSVIHGTALMLQAFAEFGMGITTTKYVAELKTNGASRAGRIIALSTLVAALVGSVVLTILWLGAPWLATHVLANPRLVRLIRIGSGMVLFGAITAAQTGSLAGLQAFRTLAKTYLFSGLASVPIVIIGTLRFGIEGTVAALTISSAVGWAIQEVAVYLEAKKAGIRIQYRGCMAESQVLWIFSLPGVLATILIAPIHWACSALIANQLHGYEQLGIFNAANQWRLVILFIPSGLSSIVLPMLSHLHKEKQIRNYRIVLRYNLIVNFGLASLSAIIFTVFSKYIISTYGSGFESARSVLAILAVSAVVMAVLSVITQILASKGKMWWSFSLNLIWGATQILFTWLFRRYGAIGLALATLVGTGVHLVAALLFTWRMNKRLFPVTESEDPLLLNLTPRES